MPTNVVHVIVGCNVLAVMLYGVGDFFQPVAVFCCQCFYCLLHGNCVGVGGIGGKKDAIGRAGHKGHKADDNNNTECHANPCSNGRDKTVQADKKMPYCRAHRHSRLAGAAGGFLDSKLHLTGTGLHLCLGCYAPHSFICGGSQLALTLGHTTNISWRGLGGDDFFFRPLAGQICPTARVPLCIGQRAALDLFGADTALIGGVDADGFGLLGGTAFPVFFYLFAGNLAPLLHGEICVLLDDRIGCIGYRRAGILRSCIITVSLRRSAFSQHGSAFLLGLRPRLFQRSFRDFPGCIASRHMRGWLFFNIFHGITPRHKLFKLNFKIVQTAFKFYTQVAAIISLVIKTNAGSIPHTTAP